MVEGRQGRHFEDDTVTRIKHFLAETEMSISEIATRMGCSRSSVAAINRKCAIRLYFSKRGSWQAGMIEAASEMDSLASEELNAAN